MEKPYDKLTDEEIAEMNDTLWPKCATCNHFAESHDVQGGDGCEGDNEGDECNCKDYLLPKGWIIVQDGSRNGKPVRVDHD